MRLCSSVNLFPRNADKLALESAEFFQQIISDQATAHATLRRQPHAGMSTSDMQRKLKAWEEQAVALWTYLTGKPFKVHVLEDADSDLSFSRALCMHL